MLLLHKRQNKPIAKLSLYRPIFLLDGVGKLMERLLLNLMSQQVAIGLAPKQFGFRPGRGTI